MSRASTWRGTGYGPRATSEAFESVADALAFAERYLVEERSFTAVEVAREVRDSRYPQSADAEPSCLFSRFLARLGFQGDRR